MALRANPYRPSNPNTTLEMMRKAAERLAEKARRGNYKPADVDVLLDAFRDLDEHLSEGGELPDDWADATGDDDADEDDDAEFEPIDDDADDDDDD